MGTACAIGVFCVFSIASAADWADLRQNPHDIVGTLSCSSVACHGNIESPRGPRSAAGQEYLHWLEGPDPHALAGRRVAEPRFQEVLKKASHRADGTADPRIYNRCANCHDPLAVGECAHETASQDLQPLIPALSPREREGAEPARSHGIGCESCHGGARRWLTTHFERDTSREQLRALGMTDTKQVLVRARLCAACHVGSAENDVNHDFLAAGHPPLRFEMASYQALIERKHWDDGPRRLREPDYEVQLWAAGRIASAEAALTLLEGRARRADQRGAAEGVPHGPPWPEFAEANCFACHQSLRPKVGQRALAPTLGQSPGVPQWQTWNTELTPLAGSDALTSLQAAMHRSLVPRSGEVARLAAEAQAALKRQVRVSPSGNVLEKTGVPFDARTLLESLAVGRGAPTWERCCHELAALGAAERAIFDRTKPLAKVAVFSQTATTARGAEDDSRRIAAALRFPNDRYEWPGVFGPLAMSENPAVLLTIDEVAAKLEMLRVELYRRCSSTEY